MIGSATIADLIHIGGLGTSLDPHITSVRDAITKKGVKVEILDYDNPSVFEISLSKTNDFKFVINGRPQNPSLIWFRSKLRLPNYIGTNESRSQFAKISEWIGTLHAIKAIYADKVLPRPAAIMLNQHKLYQARIAVECGLNTPSSLISNSRDAGLKFADMHNNDLIIKSIGPGIVPHANENHLHEVLMTMKTSKYDIEKYTEHDFAQTPSLLQKRIIKKVEYRIQIVGNQVFSFLINSQESKVTEIDWRYGNLFLDFMPVPLLNTFVDKLLLFMNKSGLNFGSIDVIQDIDDEFWFLECNPDGQWKWLDDAVDGAISKAFAELFCAIHYKRTSGIMTEYEAV